MPASLPALQPTRLLVLLLLSLASLAIRAAGPPSVQSLDGAWRFGLDPGDTGVGDRWFARDLPDKIRLPGILQAQGYGDPIRPDTPWVLTLGDAWWKIQAPALRDRFSQPGRVEVPFLAQPPRHYLGAAWYQRDIDIPRNWANRRIALFLERAHWESTVWVDGARLAPERSLSAPHVSDLGMLAPGRHRLSIRVDNRQIIRDPLGDGHAVDSHSLSDSLGAAWNGIVGRIELEATAPVWLDEIQVFPDWASRSIRAHVRIGNATGRAGDGKIAVGENSATVHWERTGVEADLITALPAGVGQWDEFHPATHQLTVALTESTSVSQVLDRRTVDYGVRAITHAGPDLLINGRPLNLRMTHSGGDFPLTGYPATDVPAWRRIFGVCQSYGLNGMRFHSWCPPEAAFTAADQLGFYLQPECGLWAPFRPGGVYAGLLAAESAAIVRAFGNHPSFILLSPSNEPGGHYGEVTPAWAAAWFARDPRRLYSAGTGWSLPAQVTGGAQYAALVAYHGVQLRGRSGWAGGDYRAALAGVPLPVIAHEVGQWCAYPDFGVIGEFTGYLRPGNFHIFRALAEQTGALEYDRAFAAASGRFQLECYKEEIEANLRTPGLAGFQLLDLHDYLGQGTALIGVTDAFWNPKSYVTARQFREFSGATVPLARLRRRVFTTADYFSAEVELAHFGRAPLPRALPRWKITTARGRTVAAGQWPVRVVPLGKNLPLGSIEEQLGRWPAPEQYTLTVELAGTDVINRWDFWLYPARIDPAVPAGVLVTRDWAAAAARLGAGGKVLFCPEPRELDPGRCPPMQSVPVFWNIQMTVRPPRNPTPRFDAMLGLLCAPGHPALAEFPTAAQCDWQWTPLIDGIRSINLTGAPRELKPIVAAIDDWNRNWRLGVIFECQVGSGRLLVSALDVAEGGGPAEPGLRQLRRSLLDYMAGDEFHPAARLSVAQAGALWPGPAGNPGRPPGPRVFDADLDDGSGAPRR